MQNGKTYLAGRQSPALDARHFPAVLPELSNRLALGQPALEILDLLSIPLDESISVDDILLRRVQLQGKCWISPSSAVKRRFETDLYTLDARRKLQRAQ